MRSLLAAYWHGDRDRWLLWIPVLSTFGAIAYMTAPQEPLPYAAAGLTVVLAASAALLFRAAPAPAAVMIACAALAAGFWLAQHRATALATPVLERPAGRVEVAGQIRVLERRERRARLLLALDKGRASDRIAHLDTVRITMPLAHAAPLAVGMTVTVPAVLRPPARQTHPGGFDFRRWAWFRGISATGFTVGTPAVEPAETAAGAGILLARLRDAISARVRSALPGETGDVAAALITGDRSGLSEETLRAMRDSGLAHLLAISGLHLGLVAMTVFVSVRFCLALEERVALRYPIKKIAAVAALLVAFLYLLISGGAVPTLRAFLMTGVLLVAVLTDRQAISMRSVALAAAAIVILYPEATAGPSFQLSFAAVVALVSVYEAVGGWWFTSERAGLAARAGRYAAGVLSTTAIATVATMPVALFHFGRIATLGLVSNLAAVPIMAFVVMPAALAGLLLMPLGLEGPFLALMGAGIEAILWIAALVAGWELSHFSIAALPPVSFGMIAAGMLWLALWRQRWRYWGALAVAAGVIAGLLHTGPTVLVAEEGGAVLVRMPDGAVSISPGGGQRFIRERWLEAFGNPDPVAWPGGVGRCDAQGCLFTIAGKQIAVTEDARALPEDCRRADILIASVPVSRRRCKGPERVIDFFDLWRGGTHSVTVTGNAIRVTMVDPPGRSRPWARDRWEDRDRDQ